MKFIQPTRRCRSTRGFTLIELLVVVLIIGILAAIALPQYQKAVLKSRYSGLMPIANAVANGQEIYYMEKGNYTSDITKLDIIAPRGGVNANIQVSDGTDERFEYVLAFKDDLPGLAYVVYQKHSPQFANTVMCEANDELNSKATWLCKDALKGTKVESGSLIDGWTAYILKGTEGSSTFLEPGACTGTAPTMTASKTGATSTAECVDGEWKFLTWTVENPTPRRVCTADEEYACAGSTFATGGDCIGGDAANACVGSTFANRAMCVGSGANACANSTFTGRSSCGGSGANACAGSTFTDGAWCSGSGANLCAGSTFTDGAYCSGSSANTCAGAIIQDGGYCKGVGDNTCAGAIIQDGGYCTGFGNACAGAIIQDGGYCAGSGCTQAEYPENGTGCCKSGCSASSGIRKCPTGVWDGESYW